MVLKKKAEGRLTIDGKEIVVSTGELAFQANAAVTVSCGGTTLLATVVSAETNEEISYFPLQVEYIERLYAGGRIKGSRWVKREGRPSDEAILTARLVDRAIRPLFPAGFRREVQVVITVLSVDLENDPSVLAVLAASAALHLSDVPWEGPIGVVRVGFKDGTYFANPTDQEREFSDLDLVVATGKEGVVMLEAGANQVEEERFFAGVEFGAKEGEKIIEFLEKLRKEEGKKKFSFTPFIPSEELVRRVDQQVGSRIKKIAKELTKKEKKEDQGEELAQLEELEEEVKTIVGEGEKASLVRETISLLFKKAVRKEILAGKRPGGRGEKQIRPLVMKVGVLPRTHGSALFQRGETQVLTVTTLGGPSLKQLIESAEGEEVKRYIHHYFMPPYAVGETGRFGWPGRREIGHGALAERALLPVIPPEERFPYTIRLVSEVLSSNGSTSMASVCGSTLSLMDAGVPISAPVGGISIGLVKEGEKEVLLTDIAGIEDFNGDMDFKVAGTEKGITAVQVDIKLKGLSLPLVREALSRAREAREEILAAMKAVIPQPRAQTSRYAPKVEMFRINEDKIGDLIGPGGRTIRKIIDETGCTVEVDDNGTVSVTGLDEKSVAAAVERIQAITREIKEGEEFEGVVKRLQPFGAFVEFLPGKEGLIHISRLATGYLKDPRQVLKVGERIRVRVREIDEMGRVNLEPTQPLVVSSSWKESPLKRRRPPDRFASRFAQKRRR